MSELVNTSEKAQRFMDEHEIERIRECAVYR